ncbi:VCBS repeat-containing protein [Pseudenhygromyxa sp. WMMC2535]|uniref:FG-GAP-like repeat-containing protein n=1 Tax=Pseudenhygromyxa sp. WMMC2535 TaxID=2712867 RepID=UPI0015555B68|nr:FG-GAP-like repeat-containing protein [Pseudenhygromyxa sp. WMMC2535]NVB42348.1 VCBS repeat-containing protein [Pseudenhygromyxa sp. WMMC2535]
MTARFRLVSLSLPTSALLAAPLCLAACKGDDGRAEASDDEVGLESSGSDESESEGESAEDSSSSGTTLDTEGGEPDLPPECDPTCEDDETCIDGTCCAAESICAGVCCGGDEVCSFAECVVPGEECIDASECPDDHYCEYSLGESEMSNECQGTTIQTGKCLPSPPDCPPGEEPDPNEDLTCLAECEYHPETSFAPELKHHIPDLHVMMAPIVTQLDDDNCDGAVDERDIPEIVFSSFESNQYSVNGTLHAYSIVDGALVSKFSINPQSPQLHPGVELASGDVGGMAGAEIFGCATTGQVRAFNPDGTELWTSDYSGGCIMPSLADLDHDGQVEVIVRGGVLDALTGTLEATFPIAQVSVQVLDIDGDGDLEIAGPLAVFEADGSTKAMTGLTGRWTAAADINLDFSPEVVVADFDTHLMHIYHWDEANQEIVIDRQNLDINGPLSPSLCGSGSAGYTRGGGPPTIADFNGDGTPDVAIAGGVGYAVIDGTKILDPNIADADAFLWIQQTHDCSSAGTGSSVFDFDGDGSAEVVYSDEWYLRIYEGSTGNVLWQTCNTTGTLRELPVVADVDSDGHADIVVVSNDYSSITCESTKQTGVRIFGDELGKWVRTRRIWNQHHYHVTNVNEDATIPAQEPTNWLTEGLNNFRQNVQPEGEFSAPDLVVDILASCQGGYEAIARVRNVGQAAVPPGVIVGFYDGDPEQGGTLLGQSVTTKTLYPAEAEDVVLSGDLVPEAIQDGDEELWVVVDDGMPEHAWHECRTDNNVHHEEAGCGLIG